MPLSRGGFAALRRARGNALQFVGLPSPAYAKYRDTLDKWPRNGQANFLELSANRRFTREPAVGFEPTTC
jgi:hypothetical protein